MTQMHEIRQAVRSLWSWRNGAVVAVLTLAVGIGTATSMYALVRWGLRSTIPDIDDLPALGRVFTSSRTLGVERAQITLRDADLLAGISAFESVGAWTFAEGEVGADARARTIEVGRLSGDLLVAMRARASIGRLFTGTEIAESASVAVVSEATWRTHFAGQSLGTAVVTVEGRPWTIVGVLSPEFGFPFIGVSADAWTPMPRTATTAAQRVSVLARLKPGATWNAAAAQLDALARTQDTDRLWTWRAIPVEEDVRARTSGSLLLMFGPAAVVLLIGCTNIACMLLGRGVGRDVELSVRAALGASRWRIVRQLFAEHASLAVAGGALGLTLAFLLLRVISAQLAQFRPGSAPLVASATMLLPIAVGFTTIACLAFGTLPALRLSRRDIATSLKGGTRPAVAHFVGYRARDLVVFLEIGTAVGLVVTASMFVRFFIELQRVTPLFDANRVLAVEVPADASRAASERVAALPGVSAVTVASAPPGARRPGSAARVSADNGRASRASLVDIDPDFFDTMGIAVIRGRSFSRGEGTATDPVIVVSESAAATLWPGGDPIGARVTLSGRAGSGHATVIGVARDATSGRGLMTAGLLAPEVYLPIDLSQSQRVLLLVRTAADPHLLVKPLGAAARTTASTPPPRVELLSEGATFVQPESWFVIYLFAGFGAIALLLAASGIFGVISQSVAQRTTEFGVRMALGATAFGILRMVLVREGRLIAAALVTGILVTVLITHSAFVEMLVITGTDARLWLVVLALCGGTAATALLSATYRLVRLDPGTLLKQT